MRGKWRSVNGRHGVVAAGFSALLALAVAHIIADIWARPRPYDAHPGAHLFIAPSGDPSFPSDHATAAFAIAAALFLRHRRAGWIALAMATLVSVARVAVGTHYPADVAAGAVIGTVAALVLWHPFFREPLHRLAEWAGRIYDSKPAMHEARPRVGRASLEGNSLVDSPGGLLRRRPHLVDGRHAEVLVHQDLQLRAVGAADVCLVG